MAHYSTSSSAGGKGGDCQDSGYGLRLALQWIEFWGASVEFTRGTKSAEGYRNCSMGFYDGQVFPKIPVLPPASSSSLSEKNNNNGKTGIVTESASTAPCLIYSLVHGYGPEKEIIQPEETYIGKHKVASTNCSDQ